VSGRRPPYKRTKNSRANSRTWSRKILIAVPQGTFAAWIAATLSMHCPRRDRPREFMDDEGNQFQEKKSWQLQRRPPGPLLTKRAMVANSGVLATFCATTTCRTWIFQLRRHRAAKACEYKVETGNSGRHLTAKRHGQSSRPAAKALQKDEYGPIEKR
jgi:hypothetical protein